MTDEGRDAWAARSASWNGKVGERGGEKAMAAGRRTSPAAANVDPSTGAT